jgi:hypothetical protein
LAAYGQKPPLGVAVKFSGNRAIDEATQVPEPGTLILLGIGWLER